MHMWLGLIVYIAVIVSYLFYLSLPKANLENFNLLRKLPVGKYRKTKIKKSLLRTIFLYVVENIVKTIGARRDGSGHLWVL